MKKVKITMYGYPGWHIECSAMSIKYLGEQFDLHCGGIDHIQVHHTNEIAQSEAATGKIPWVKYWLHNEFLVLDKGEKMAKSGENFLKLSLLEEKGYPALAYRYFCLGTHYRKPLFFSYEAMDGAKNAYLRLKDKILEIKKASPEGENPKLHNQYIHQFKEQINDDLNSPQALATLWDMLKDERLSPHDKYQLALKFDEILGLGLGSLMEERVTIPAEIKALAEERELARKNKDWKTSDEIREKITALGYAVSDGKEGYKVSKIG